MANRRVRRLPPLGEPLPAAVVPQPSAQRSFPTRRDVRLAARAIKMSPGVRGVAFGIRRRGGDWHREYCVVAYVENKWPRERLQRTEDFEVRFPGVPVDVVRIGDARTAAVEASDAVTQSGFHDRSGITAVLNYTSGVWVLASGHGVAPGGAPTEGIGHTRGHRVTVNDDWTRRFPALVYSAEFTGTTDVSLLRLESSEAPRVEHPLTGTSAPFQLRRTPIRVGLQVKHFSPNQQRVLHGHVTAIADPSSSSTGVRLRAPNGESVEYPEVLVIAATQGRFSDGGDSGSLVTDQMNKVIGTVIGGSDGYETLADGRVLGVTFVLPLTRHSLRRRSSRIDLGKFFE